VLARANGSVGCCYGGSEVIRETRQPRSWRECVAGRLHPSVLGKGFGGVRGMRKVLWAAWWRGIERGRWWWHVEVRWRWWWWHSWKKLVRSAECLWKFDDGVWLRSGGKGTVMVKKEVSLVRGDGKHMWGNAAMRVCVRMRWSLVNGERIFLTKRGEVVGFQFFVNEEWGYEMKINEWGEVSPFVRSGVRAF